MPFSLHQPLPCNRIKTKLSNYSVNQCEIVSKCKCFFLFQQFVMMIKKRRRAFSFLLLLLLSFRCCRYSFLLRRVASCAFLSYSLNILLEKKRKKFFFLCSSSLRRRGLFSTLTLVTKQHARDCYCCCEGI